MDLLGLWAFWIAVGVIAYTLVGFPLLLALRASFFPQSVRREDITPSVSIIIAAHNEEDVIERKLANTFALDYPHEKLEVIVVSDGSDDETNAHVRRIDNPLLKLLSLPRVGKNRAINEAVTHANGEVLVFTDADSMLRVDGLRELVAPFADARVGAVGGDFRYLADGSSRGAGERLYWKLDRLWKTLQSKGGSMTSATGQLYALRRYLFRAVPPSVTDDFYTSVQAMAAGLRLVFASCAVATGPVAESMGAEFARKVRVMTRGLNSVWQMNVLLNPKRHGLYAVQLFSHKVLRRLLAVPLVVVFVANATVLDHGALYVVLFIVQVLVYGLGALGYAFRYTAQGQNKLLAVPYFFLMVNIAGVTAAYNILRGRGFDVWTTERATIGE